jgi:hypothetical protein
VLLIGLVALNVSLLKLNAAAGRNAEIAKKLRVENADLRGRVSRLGSGDRLQEAAARLGLMMPRADDVHYLTANPSLDARRAARHAQWAPISDTSDLVTSIPEEPLTPPVALPPSGPVGATGTGAPQAASGASAPPAAPAPQTAAAPQTTAQQPAQPQPTPPAAAPATGAAPASGTTSP